MQISKKFIQSLKLSTTPAYQLAWRAGIHPNTLSKLVTGYLRVKKNDPRLLKIGELLGLKPEDIFKRERVGHEK